MDLYAGLNSSREMLGKNIRKGSTENYSWQFEAKRLKNRNILTIKAKFWRLQQNAFIRFERQNIELEMLPASLKDNSHSFSQNNKSISRY